MQLDPQRRSATNGTLAGVLAPADIAAEARRLGGNIDPDVCSGSVVIDSLVTLIQQAADILLDATQDPAKTCDGISIGLGFNAVRAELGPIAAREAPPPSSCPEDAGTDADAGDAG
jgi:hypothetical protein